MGGKKVIISIIRYLRVSPEEIFYCEPGYTHSLYQSQLGVVYQVPLCISVLDVWHRVEGHPYGGDDDEGDGDAGDDFSCHGSVGLLNEIPETDLVLDEPSATEIFLYLRNTDKLC